MKKVDEEIYDIDICYLYDNDLEEMIAQYILEENFDIYEEDCDE